MQFGRYLEEFEVGAVYKHWPGKTITQAEDILFCSITMNQHPVHADDNYAAAASPTGKAMVVGNLVYSIVLGQSIADVSGRAIANLEVEQLEHANPTFHGDTVYSETEVLDVRESSSKPDRGVVTVRTIGYKQDGTVVCEFSRKVLVPKKEQAGEAMPGRPEPRTRDGETGTWWRDGDTRDAKRRSREHLAGAPSVHRRVPGGRGHTRRRCCRAGRGPAPRRR